MKLLKRIKAKFDHHKRRFLFYKVDPFKRRNFRCIFCGSVMYSSSRKRNSNLFWKYYLKSMICDVCHQHKTKNMTKSELEEFEDEYKRYAIDKLLLNIIVYDDVDIYTS